MASLGKRVRAPVISQIPKQLKSNLGETIYLLRKAAKISQTELGKLLSLHQTAICRIEQGAQNVTPEELYILSRFFELKIDSLLAGEVDFWRVAERFGRLPPLPERYTELPFSKVREVLPLLQFMRKTRNSGFVDKVLGQFDLKPAYLVSPDQKIGVNCHLDVLRHLVRSGMVTTGSLRKLTDHSRSDSVQGFLHPIYETQASVLPLLQTWILSAHHYETNFKYDIQELSRDSLVLSVTPAEHMAGVEYKDDVLKDVLCEYKKTYLSEFPRYIGAEPVSVQEKECHFHGASRCIYRVKAAA